MASSVFCAEMEFSFGGGAVGGTRSKAIDSKLP